MLIITNIGEIEVKEEDNSFKYKFNEINKNFLSSYTEIDEVFTMDGYSRNNKAYYSFAAYNSKVIKESTQNEFSIDEQSGNMIQSTIPKYFISTGDPRNDKTFDKFYKNESNLKFNEFVDSLEFILNGKRIEEQHNVEKAEIRAYRQF